MSKKLSKSLSKLSLFSGSALMMAFSLLSVIVLLIWWERLLSRNLENQYRFFKTQLAEESDPSESFARYIREQDIKLAAQIFPADGKIAANAAELIDNRLANRQKMVLYEQIFFILLLLSGHIFFLYIYFRERARRKLTEETVLLATHELRQPLQSLSLALETIAPRAQGKSLRAIETGLADIGKLSQQIRWLAETFVKKKPAREMTAIANFGVFLAGFITDEFATQKKRIETHINVHRSLQLPLTLPLFRFVLRNLVENALKYADDITAITADITGRYLFLTVASSGKIINPSDFSKIGSVFFRSSTSAVQNTSGFGLGLYLSGRIVRSANGRLSIEHETSGKTTAVLRLRCI